MEKLMQQFEGEEVEGDLLEDFVITATEVTPPMPCLPLIFLLVESQSRQQWRCLIPSPDMTTDLANLSFRLVLHAQ